MEERGGKQDVQQRWAKNPQNSLNMASAAVGLRRPELEQPSIRCD